MRTENLPDGKVRQRLETWGEIATYLGVEIRTAQRWEKRMALPVRRLDGGQAVYALADDLDAWRAARERGSRDGTIDPTPITPASAAPADLGAAARHRDQSVPPAAASGQ